MASSEPATDSMPSQAGGGANIGGVTSPGRPQELQNMRLVVDAGDGRTIEIPLTGHLTTHNSGSPSQDAYGEQVPEQSSGGAGPETAAERRISIAELQNSEAQRHLEAGGGTNNGGVINPDRPQELQNMRLVVDVGGGRTIEIPVTGHLTLQNSVEASRNGGSQRTAAAEQRTAVAESENAEAKEYLDKMRGWLMTVATLFVSIIYQAMSQRPSWMPDPKDGVNYLLGPLMGKHVNSSDPAQEKAGQVLAYMLLNTITFSMSLAVVMVLLLPNMSSPKITLRTVRFMMVFLAILAVLDFSFMISMDNRTNNLVLAVMAIHGVGTVVIVRVVSRLR